MLDSILEFITQAASSSAFIFCFCNLIIVIILVDLKPSLSVHQESEIPLTMDTTQKQGTNSKCLVEKDRGSSPQAAEVSHIQEAEAERNAIAVYNTETKDNDDGSNEEEEKVDEEENEEDDNLRRRVEEFIEKVNKGWKAELLNTSSLV